MGNRMMLQLFIAIVISGVTASQLSLALLGRGEGLDFHWVALNAVMRVMLTTCLFMIQLSVMINMMR